MVVLPRTPVPVLRSGQGYREDRWIQEELQGTRILGSSRATPHRQTVIVINIFSLNYVMCIEGGKTGRKRERNTQGDEGGKRQIR